jgi:diguanylate cyclase (GGDEF)-like protein
MLDRIALRATFWGALTLLSAVIIFASAGTLTVPSFVSTAPFLAALAMLMAIAGWRLLHRELLHRMQDDVALRDRMRRLQEAIHGSVDGMFLLRAVRDTEGELVDFEITDVNGSGVQLVYGGRRELVGQRLRRDLPTRMGASLFERYADVLVMRTPLVEETRVSRRLMSASWLLHQAVPTTDGLAVTVRDISTHKREERRLRRASLTDDLTGLYNRRGFMALADQQLRVARRQGKDAVVMYADMDDFKQINDTYGHALGDRALMAVARLLTDTVRDCDVVARLGGDEFTVLALDADGAGARAIQRRVDERLAVLNASDAFPTTISLTVGFTRVRPSDTAGVSELLARADQLLYQRKRRRRLTKVDGAAQPTAVATKPSAPMATRTPRRGARVVSSIAPTISGDAIPATVAAVARATAMALPNVSPIAGPGTPSSYNQTSHPASHVA